MAAPRLAAGSPSAHVRRVPPAREPGTALSAHPPLPHAERVAGTADSDAKHSREAGASAQDDAGTGRARPPNHVRHEMLLLAAAWGAVLLGIFVLAPAWPPLGILVSLSFPVALVVTGWCVRLAYGAAALVAVSALLAATGASLVVVEAGAGDPRLGNGVASVLVGLVFLGLGRLGRLLSTQKGRAQAAQAEAGAAHASEERLALFLRAAAHEIGNPLTPMLIEAETLRAHPAVRGEPGLLRSAERLERSVARLRRLTHDLQDAGRNFQGRLQVQKCMADLAPVLRDVAEQNHPAFQHKHITFDVVVPATLPAEVDLDRVAQAVDNLLQNALRYTPAGGRVLLGASSDQEGIRVTVQDSGLGMTREQIGRLFQPLVRLHPEVAPGMGLGLWLTSSIASAHGGVVEAKSAGPGKGSVFILRLPTFASDPPARNGHASPLAAVVRVRAPQRTRGPMPASTANTRTESSPAPAPHSSAIIATVSK